jgi:hypothetical protein
MRNAVPDQHLGPGAAHAAQVDALGARGLGRLHQGGLAHGLDHGLEEVRLVPVDDDVNVVLFEHPHVHFDRHRCRNAEENVRDLGGDHGAAPPVGQCRTAALFGDVDVVLVDAHVGAVHQLHDLAHGPAGNQPVLAPQL